MKKLNFNKINEFPKISQWFISLEGEGENIGEPSLYLRLSGCFSAACKFCDTKFSWYEAKNNEDLFNPKFLKTINEEIGNREIQRLTITGGEPLHYVDYFNEIVQEVKSIPNLNLKYVGFETNGNLLQDKNLTLDLIREMNKIKNVLGVKPTITISPKMDAETCYENQLTQKEVINMYSRVLDNTINYLDDEYINYKFIWGVNETMNKLVINFIDYLRLNGIKAAHIFLMPFTPEDPLGKDKEFWETSKNNTSRKALEIGVRYSPRIHIDRNLD